MLARVSLKSLSAICELRDLVKFSGRLPSFSFVCKEGDVQIITEACIGV